MSDITKYLEALTKTILRLDPDQTVILLKPDLEDVNSALPLYFELGQKYNRNLKITRLHDSQECHSSGVYFFSEKPIREAFEEIAVYLSEDIRLECVLTHYYMSDSRILTRNNKGDTKEFLMLNHPDVLKKPSFLSEYKFCLDIPYEYTMTYHENTKPLNLYLGYRRSIKTRQYELLPKDQLESGQELYKSDDYIIELIPDTWKPREIIENRSQLFPKPDLLFVWSPGKPNL